MNRRVPERTSIRPLCSKFTSTMDWSGLCYPPLKHEVALELPALDGGGAVQTSPSQTSMEEQSVTGTLRPGHAERADAS